MARRALGLAKGSGPLAAVAALLVALVTAFGTGALSLPHLGGGGVERLSERQVAYTEWDADEYPEYYRVVGPAVVDVELEPGELCYEGLDELGRTGRAVANITPEMAEEGSRSTSRCPTETPTMARSSTAAT